MFRYLLSLMTSTHRVPIPPRGVDYRGKVVLAPMVRSGELPTRLLALKYGADLVWGPETIDRALVGASRRVNPRNGTIEFTRLPSNGGRAEGASQESVIYRIDPVREKGKLIFQLGTGSLEYALPAAKLVAGDIAGIDVNAGCPKPFSTSGGMGAALLQDPDRLASILEMLIKEVGNPFQIGVSVKIRILNTPEKTEALVRKLCSTGITGLTVHCRTTPMRPRERAIRDQLQMISSVCRNAGVACVMNGDVASRDEALALMKEYDVDSAMIATAAESNPSCFRSQAQGGLVPWKELVYEYLQACLQTENRFANTKFLLNIFIPGKNKEGKAASACKTYVDYCHVLKFDDLIPAALQVDENIGLSGKSVLFSQQLDGTTEPLNDNEGVSTSTSPRNKAVQNAMESNESARAASGATSGGSGGVKSIPPSGSGGPIRTTSIPSNTARPKPEETSAVDLATPTQQQGLVV